MCTACLFFNFNISLFFTVKKSSVIESLKLLKLFIYTRPLKYNQFISYTKACAYM